MSRLWDRGEESEEAALRLTTGRDPQLDLELVPFDALASAAHATMLATIDVLSQDDLESLSAELVRIVGDMRAGKFSIELEQEDGHTAIENRLTERLGDPGRRIHTGRSRNDQVIAALRLWGREQILAIAEQTAEVARLLTVLAREHAQTSMPGYSHARQAMPTTLGHPELCGIALHLLGDDGKGRDQQRRETQTADAVGSGRHASFLSLVISEPAPPSPIHPHPEFLDHMSLGQQGVSVATYR